jgi:hypothetical protein
MTKIEVNKLSTWQAEQLFAELLERVISIDPSLKDQLLANNELIKQIGETLYTDKAQD